MAPTGSRANHKHSDNVNTGDAMTETQTPCRRPRITHAQRVRLSGLLPMEYRPTELAREIGCHRSTIYESYVPNGCPHRRDRNGHLWIVGTDFAAWARATIQQSRIALGAGEAFCMRCKRAVVMRGPLREVEAKGALLIHGTCPQCFGEVARFESPDRRVG